MNIWTNLGWLGELRFIYVSIFHSSHSVCLPNSTFLVNVLWRKKRMWFCLARIKSCRSSVCASPSLASTLFYSVLPGVHFSKSILSTRCHCFWPKWMSELAQSFLLVLKMQISEPCQSTSNTALPGTVFLTCKCSQREKQKLSPSWKSTYALLVIPEDDTICLRVSIAATKNHDQNR